MQNEHLLDVNNLSISFVSNNESKEVIHNISYKLNKNEILGIVGESGSGKSVSSLAIMGLLPMSVSKINAGEILFDNRNLVNLNSIDLQSIRGNVFFESINALW